MPQLTWNDINNAIQRMTPEQRERPVIVLLEGTIQSIVVDQIDISEASGNHYLVKSKKD